MKIRKIAAFALGVLMLTEIPMLTLAETSEIKDTSNDIVFQSETEKESNLQIYYGTISKEETSEEVIWNDFPEVLKEGQAFYVALGKPEGIEYDLLDLNDYTIVTDNGKVYREFSETSDCEMIVVTPEQPGQLCLQAYWQEETEPIAEVILQVEENDTVSQNDIESIDEAEDDLEVVDENDENADEDSVKTRSEFTLNYSDYILIAGDTLQLKTSAAAEEEIKFSSSDTQIATVSAGGLVTAVGVGTCTITAKSEDYSAICNITVNGSITISDSSAKIYTGDTKTLQAVTKPLQSNVNWSSSAPNIASVSQSGVITAQKEGKATIKAEANGVSAECSITVKNKTLSLNKSKLTAYIGYAETLKATTAPSAKVTWKSSNKKVATVNSQGKITPKKAGSTTITATGNGISKKCTVTVKKAKLKLNSSKIYVFKNNTKKITAKNAPSKSIKWKSKNSKIASVDKNGLVTGKKAGTTTITATLGKTKKTCEVQVLKNEYKLNRTKSTLTKGDKVKLHMKNVSAGGNVTFSIESGKSKAVDINTNGNLCTIKALEAGTVTIRATYYHNIDGTSVECYDTAVITVNESGINPSQCSVAKGLTKQFSVKNVSNKKDISSVAWSSSNQDVASINFSTGLLTAKKSGSTQITAVITFVDNTTGKYTASAKVSDPKMKTKKKAIANYSGYSVGISGTNSYSDISWKSSHPKYANVGANGWVSTYASTSKKIVITATVDGKKLTQELRITNPSLKDSFQLLSKGTTTKIKIKGKASKSKVKYKSKNPSVASVSSKGVVKGKKNGNAFIEVTVDGKKLIFTAHVVPRKVINAVRTAESIMYSSTYSQAYRMTQGYYDCSSLTFRAYGSEATQILGGVSSWAPTAAAQAQYLEAKGKVISYKGIPVSELRPGDLIFYAGSPNGRFKNINHVSMYYGGGLRLEKPFCYYSPNANIVMIARPVS